MSNQPLEPTATLSFRDHAAALSRIGGVGVGLRIGRAVTVNWLFFVGLGTKSVVSSPVFALSSF